MRVSLNLDDVANRIAKPWSFVVIMTVMIVSRSPWRVPPEKSINQTFSNTNFFFFLFYDTCDVENYFITFLSPLRAWGRKISKPQKIKKNREEALLPDKCI